MGANRRSRGPVALARILGAATLFLVASAVAQPSSEGRFSEADVQAALIYKFAKFITWPEGAFAERPQHHVFCVLGRGAMASALEKVVAGKTLGHREVLLRRVRSLEEAFACQVVFVPADEATPRLADVLGRRPILLVGDVECFTQRGGMINFYRDRNRLRFEIHRTAIENAGLRVSSELLRLARIVERNGECD